jgi:hypothetical protein
LLGLAGEWIEACATHGQQCSSSSI